MSVSLEGIGNVVIDAMSGNDSVRERWWQKVRQPLPREWIKKRQGPGGRTLDYIEGHKAVELISEASMGTYSFLVLDAFIEDGRPVPLKVRNERGYEDPVVEITCPSCGKPYRTIKAYRQEAAKCSHCQYQVSFKLYPGEPVWVRTEPIAHVLGMLIVPGVGAVMQWGSKILQGGSTEQEHTFKSATTDALKKCASLLGVALELYDKDDAAHAEPIQAVTPSRPSVDVGGYANPERPNMHVYLSAPQAAPKVPEAATASQPAPAAHVNGNGNGNGAAPPTEWPQEEVQRLNRLRQMMGIPQDNRNMLNPLVSAWSQGKIESWQGLNPTNIKSFNDYLESLLLQPEPAQA